MPKFYVTTPIYYVNAKPHIGHAYTTFVADALARAHRLRGDDVKFITGTDENSQKNIEAMKAVGETDLQTYLDRMAGEWQQTWKDLGITNDDFICTSQPRHLNAVERFWKAVEASGDIYKGKYEGLYCLGCEAFKTETEVIEDKCPLHPNKELQNISEENYFFKLSAYRKQLLALFDGHPAFIQPESRRNEIRSYVDKFLTDISISRPAKSVEAGIGVPGDPSQRIYVWFDALINYLTAVGYGSDDEPVKQWWPADLHLVGKDIIKFHCALWPAMLMSAAKNDPLLGDLKDNVIPRHVFAHGFFTINGQKISKSLGNAIDPVELSQKYGSDVVRYFLLREISFGEDGDFSEDRLRERHTADLANTLGNLLQRVVSMSRKTFDGTAPTADIEASQSISTSTWNSGHDLQSLWGEYEMHVDTFRLNEAMEAIWGNGRASGVGLMHANKLIEETQPFKLPDEDPKKAQILYALLESCRHYAWMLAPIMPETARKMITALGQGYDEEEKKGLNKLKEWGGLKPGSPLPEPTPLFPRLEKTA